MHWRAYNKIERINKALLLSHVINIDKQKHVDDIIKQFAHSSKHNNNNNKKATK